ncbi:MAG: hypothetical protein EB059_11010 [Alphaproteobacteria bacterium]|nr:hypothetical protein [Alphaproteobacteria bacterium]
MRGMGEMLTMFGGAANEIESDYQNKRSGFLKAKGEYSNDMDKMSKNKLKQDMELSKKGMINAKEKMISLLKGIYNATLQAMENLDDDDKKKLLMEWSNLSKKYTESNDNSSI